MEISNKIYECKVKDLFTYNLGQDVWAIMPRGSIVKGKVESYTLNSKGVKLTVMFADGKPNVYWLGTEFITSHLFRSYKEAEYGRHKLIMAEILS